MSATAERTAERTTSEVAAVLAGGELRYSTVWEDPRLLARGLGSRAGEELLVIASAGCNVLNLLLGAPRRIVAIDVNPAQVAMLDLKLAALRRLDHAQLLALLGVRDGHDRLALYERVRRLLPAASRTWWDAHADTLALGARDAGRLDRYIAGFWHEHPEAWPGIEAVTRLFALDDAAARERLVDEAILTPAFLRAFARYFTRESLAGRARDPAQMRHVGDTDVTTYFLARLRWACTAIPTRGNWFLERFFFGAARRIGDGPPYLRPDAFARMRALAGRVEVVTEDLETYLAARPARTLGGAALSDVFEYLPTGASDSLFTQLARALRPGGRVAYWNLFVPRRSPPGAGLRLLEGRSRALARHDRAWFYRAFHVEEAA